MMKTLKLTLTTTFTLKSINYSEDANEIICTINASNEDWKENFMQIERDKKQQHII